MKAFAHKNILVRNYNKFMSILKLIASSYVIAVLLLLHATLLFCGEPHCIVPFDKPPVAPAVGYQIRQAISALLPFELKMMQKIAQWLIVGEIMFIILWIMNFIQKILCYLVWVLFALVLTFAILMYLSSNSFLEQTSDLIVNNGLATHEQIQIWMLTGRQVWGKVVSFFV